jgi:hypothetical protein
MTVRTIRVAGRDWRFAPDAPPPAIAERSQAILQAQLVDEVLGVPPALPIPATTRVRGAVARVAAGGRAGVLGRPAIAYFAPSIATSRADMTIEAPGFLPLTLDAALGAQPGYPDAFTPRDLGDVALHRLPVRLSGRIASRSLGPLSGATITVTGVWPLLQHPPGPAVAPNAMPVFAGLYADRPAGSMRRRNLTPAAQVKALVRPAVAGDTVVRLSDRQAIAAGQILAIEFGDPERVEYIRIATIDTGSSPDQPAAFTLDHPLRRDHGEGADAARAVPAAGGPNNAINRPARRGDATIWTGGLTGIGPATISIEISGGGLVPEFHATTRYITTSTADGDFRLAPIHRIAALELTVSHASQPLPMIRIVTPEWRAATQIEDFLFP